MTVNYTTNLALGQPVTGTESGTWGDDVNNSITSYLDIAIAGTLSLTSASFTANALTLANTQGTSSATNISATTAQYMVLKVSSLAANVTITAPSSSKLYLVDNTDATYTVTIKASGQTGYTVATSTRALVYFNGTDYVLASTNNRNALINTLSIANGGTGQTSASAAFNALSPITTAGDLIVGNGANSATRLAIGTNGYILTSNGTTATWSAAPPSGASISNDTATASNLYPLFSNATSGAPTTIYTSNAKLLYKPSTGELSASVHVSSNGINVNSTTVSASYTIASGNNGMSVGPITVATGQSVTVTSGQRWVVL